MKPLSKKELKKFNKEFKREKEIVLILENIEYARNVASIFRTSDASGVRKIFLTGISKTPPFGKEMKQVSRNSEISVEWKFEQNSGDVIASLRKKGFHIIGVELVQDAIENNRLKEIIENKEKIAFVFGSEVFGINKKTIEKCDQCVFIPMYGKNASLNVSVSAGIILYSF